MRVAFVSMETAHHGETPARRRTRRTAQMLAERGHDVTVCSAQWWGGDIPTFEQDGVVYRAVTETPSARAFVTKLPFALRKANPDVIQVRNSPPGHVVAAKRVARLLRVPVVADWWEDRPDDDASDYRRAAKRADAVVTPSRTVKTRVREHGADADDVRVIPESIDFSLVRDAPVDDRADLVYSRRLDEDANVETFLLALAELRGKAWRAVVIGDGPARASAEQTARDLRIDDRVTFMGELPYEERVPIFKGAHVFAQTATREAFATDLCWALACGCLGVVEYQALSSAHELVEGFDRGSLVTTPAELADEIVAAADRERKQVDERFAEYDHDDVLAEYVDCYEDVRESYGWF